MGSFSPQTTIKLTHQIPHRITPSHPYPPRHVVITSFSNKPPTSPKQQPVLTALGNSPPLTGAVDRHLM